VICIKPLLLDEFLNRLKNFNGYGGLRERELLFDRAILLVL
jgi:hypothetical protein